MAITIKPVQKPMTGAVNIGAITLSISSKNLTQPHPAFTTDAPINPPIRACEELEGKPKNQVIKFQIIAAHKAQNITWRVIVVGSIMPAPIVLATCEIGR